ncbi:MAG: hypothetical protein ABIT38_06395, partial [Gemmatimonadaceae bacterium]
SHVVLGIVREFVKGDGSLRSCTWPAIAGYVTSCMVHSSLTIYAASPLCPPELPVPMELPDPPSYVI